MPVELNSWKEIASHLHVTVRTAQLWEKERALPVRRRPGGRVFALAEELDAWKNSVPSPRDLADSGGNGTRRALPDAPLPVWRRRWLWGVSVLGAVLFAAGYFLTTDTAGYPADWRVEGNEFVATTRSGNELLRHRIEGVVHPRDYDKDTNHGLSMCSIVDLKGSRRPEVLFNSLSLRNNVPQGELLCFGRSGNPIWKFHPGRAGLRNPRQQFSPDYVVANFQAVDFRGKTGLAVLVVSFHSSDYATQVALLRPDSGEILREYWHSGFIGGWYPSQVSQLGVFDVNQDGRPEICLAGVANGYDQLPAIVVLDPDGMTGTSVEVAKEHQFEGMEPGREMARIVFPAGCLGFPRRMWATGPSPGDPGQFSVTVNYDALPEGGDPSVRYIFNSKFEVVDIVFDNTYLTEHDRKSISGEVGHPFDRPAERKRLLQVIRIGG